MNSMLYVVILSPVFIYKLSNTITASPMRLDDPKF